MIINIAMHYDSARKCLMTQVFDLEITNSTFDVPPFMPILLLDHMANINLLLDIFKEISESIIYERPGKKMMRTVIQKS